MDDVALALVPVLPVLGSVAKAAFVAVARTRNPAAITAATIINNFVVLMFYYVNIF
jgi:hypothetical protein